MLISPPRLRIPASQIARTQRLEIENRGTVPLNVTARMESLGQSSNGAALPGASAPYSAATWVTVVPSHFVVKPGTRRYIQVRFRVPRHPEPGDHNLTIVFLTPPRPGRGNIHVVAGIGVPTLITVPGPVDDDVSVRSLRTPSFSGWGAIPVVATISETGDVHHSFVGPRGRLEALASGAVMRFPAITVLRGATIALATDWVNHPVFCICRVTTAVVTDGQRSVAVSTVIIFPLVQFLIGLGILLLAVLAFLLYLRRRRQMAAS